MTGISNQPTGTRENAAERRVQALDLRKAGHSYRAIGVALDISEAQAHRDVKAALTRLAQLELAAADELRAMELARLDDLQVEATRILLTTHPLVSGGKVLSGFTDEGTAIGLTDDGPKLAAIDRLLKIAERRARLLGLDLQPGATLPGDVEIILRWHDANRTVIDVTPTDHHPAAALPGPAADRDEPGAVSYRVRWETLGQEPASGDAESEDRA